jgi:hypothetical protein
MGRGFGHVQRFVLAELDERCVSDEGWLAAHTLAGRLEGAEPQDAAVRSVRRALRLLRADGLVELGSAHGRLLARVPPWLRRDAAGRRDQRARSAAFRAQLADRPAPGR